MPASLRRFVCLVLFFIGFFARVHAAKPAVALLPPAEATSLLPAVAAFAASHDIPIAGFDLAANGAPGRDGDLLTALVTLRDAKSSRQWLLQFQTASLNEKERMTTSTTTHTVSMNKGRVHRFNASASLALKIHTIGPFVTEQKSAPKELQARTRISPEFLSLGLDQGTRGILAMGAAGAAKLALSEADERAILGFSPALMAFFTGIQATPGLRDILWAMIEKPSAWSLIKRGGKINPAMELTGVAALDGYPDWAASGVPLYRMSLLITLNEQPALNCSLFVTAPQPPLLITAGVIGIVAERPGHTDRYLDIRILAGRRGPAK